MALSDSRGGESTAILRLRLTSNSNTCILNVDLVFKTVGTPEEKPACMSVCVML